MFVMFRLFDLATIGVSRFPLIGPCGKGKRETEMDPKMIYSQY